MTKLFGTNLGEKDATVLKRLVLGEIMTGESAEFSADPYFIKHFAEKAISGPWSVKRVLVVVEYLNDKIAWEDFMADLECECMFKNCDLFDRNLKYDAVIFANMKAYNDGAVETYISELRKKSPTIYAFAIKEGLGGQTYYPIE